MKTSKIKSIIIILSVFIYDEAFSYDWNGKMEIFSYDLANRYKNEYFYVLEEYYETFKHRDRNYLTSVMPNFVNTGFWKTAFDRYFEWYEIIRIEDLGIGIDKNKELQVFNGPLFVIENVEEITSELLKVETKILAYSRQFLKYDVLNWDFISDTDDDCTFYLEFDGDYINVYANNVDKEFCTFCKMYEEDIALLRECIKTNDWNDVKVTWPRHADGSCDYDDITTEASETAGMEELANAPATERTNFAEEITYKTIGSCFSIKEGSPLYADSSKLNSYKKYDEDCLLYFILNNQTKIFGNLKTGYDQNDIIASLRIKDSDGEYRKYSLDHLKLPDLDTIPGFLTDTDKKYPKTGLLLLPEKYYKVLHKNSKQALLEEESYWEKDFHKNINNNRYDSWTEIFYPTSLFISYSYICFSRFDCDQDKMLHEISGLITDIKKINSNKYRLDFYNSISDDFSFEVDEIFKEINSKNNHFFLLDYDGDYVNVFLDSDKNIVDRFVISSDGVRSKIIEIAKKEKTSTSNIVWPCHADGSCDYEDGGKLAAESAIPKPAPAMGKTAVVTENLRMRADYDTTAEVVATLAAGTRVQVHLLGKEEIIDGIISNWVQVSVLDGAKDKDGNAVAAGTKGWLFGGYLSEAEEAVESESPNEDASVNENATLPILPIAAGVAAFAILFAMIILAVKKRKASKD